MGLGMTFGDVLAKVRNSGLENVLDRFYSLYAARVTSIEDEPQVGRASVELYSLGFEEEHPAKAWPSSPYAGCNYGFYFPAHEGDQVWTTFDHGDINCPRIVGSFWLNEGDALKPGTSHVPAEFVEADGGTATRRGIKSRGGSVLIFDDAPETYHFEIYTGEAETEEVDGKTRPKVGVVSKRHHSVRLDDADEQIAIATFGELPEGREDTDSNRIKHKIVMKDTEDDRYVSIRTIGEIRDDEEKYHQFLMSDSENKILTKSNHEHYWEIDDATSKITCSTKNGFLWELDQRSGSITISTSDDRRLILNDQTAANLLETPDSQIKQDSTGTSITESSGKIAITSASDLESTVGGRALYNITGDVQLNVGGSYISQVLTAISLVAGGTLNLQGANITMAASASVDIASPSVTIGTGSQDFVVKQEFGSSVYNPHTHIVAGLFPGVALPTANVFAPGTHSTTATKIG